jgi:MoaA/NifB/PqqE/SkfB family radical SAM enzyme
VGVSVSMVWRGAMNYLQRRPYCVSFELTHNCNARCRHCHRGEQVAEQAATPERLLEVCRQLRPLVAIMSGGEPLLRRDLLEIVRTLKQGCAPIRVFVNTNAALLTRRRFRELGEAGVNEVLISLDYPDERHDDYRKIPGLFRRIEALIAGLDAASRDRVVLTCVLQSDNFREALSMARLARSWGVSINYSAYTWLRTNDRDLMIPPGRIDELRETLGSLRDFKRANDTILTSDWVLDGMIRFFERGRLGGCRAGQRSLVVNPDGTLSPCGLLIRDYAARDRLIRDFTRNNTCGDCYTSTRGNSERPFKYLVRDSAGFVRSRNVR